MFIDIVLIDKLAANGTTTNFMITPNPSNGSIFAVKYRDIDPTQGDGVDLGGLRILNSGNCSITQNSVPLKKFVADGKFSFKIRYDGIPVGSSRNGHKGIYYLILEPDLRFIDLHIVDPHDDRTEDECLKREFKYDVFWDEEKNVQLIEMDLRSGRGSFSFLVCGSFVYVDCGGANTFIEAESGEKISNFNYRQQRNEDDKKLEDHSPNKFTKGVTAGITFFPSMGINVGKEWR